MLSQKFGEYPVSGSLANSLMGEPIGMDFTYSAVAWRAIETWLMNRVEKN